MNFAGISVIGLLLLLFGVANAQTTIYNFERISIEDGLPSNTIYDLIQDAHGFIWIGTDKGLARFDGSRMKVFVHDTDNPRSISSNVIKRLYEGKDGKIWIASSQMGLSCYDPSLPEQEAFTNYRSNLKDTMSLHNNELFDVYEDRNGYIWVAGLDTDLQRLNPNTGKFETFRLGANTLSRKSYFRFMGDEKNECIWLGSRHDGFIRFDPITFQMQQYDYTLLSKATENSVGAFAREDDKLYVSYYNLGLSVLDLKTNIFEPDLFQLGRNIKFYDNTIFTLNFDSDRNLWAGHNRKGIYLYNPETNSSRHLSWRELTPGDTTASRVEVIFFDKSNIGWIGTAGKGLLKYNPYHNRFNQFKEFSDKQNYGNVLQLLEQDHFIWFHCAKGLGKFNTRDNKTEFFISYSKADLDVGGITLIDSRLYVSSTNKGVWYVNEQNKLLRPLPFRGGSFGIDQADVNSIIGDNANGKSVLWIGSWGGGLYKYDLNAETVTRFTAENGLPDNKVIQLALGPSGELWIATQGHGVARIKDKEKMDPDVFINDPQQARSLPDNTVLCFYTDRNKRLWMGTTLGGIIEVLQSDTSTSFRYYKDDKKPAYQGLRTITENKEGNLLLFTDSGLAVFYPLTGRINHLYERTPVYPSAFPITALASHSLDNVILGTNNGYLSSVSTFSPSSTELQATISGFKIFDQDNSHLLHQTEIVLPYKENFFTIDFTTPHYSDVKNLTFGYRLNGVDKDWRYTNSNRSANYTDVEGGKYIFEVKVADSEGVWSTHTTKLGISVIPPFWATIWFKILLMFSIGVAIYLLHLYRMRQLMIIQRIRNDISKDLHDDVGATLSSIRILSEVANQKIKEHQLEYSSELMGKVGVHAAEMADNMSDIIWTFKPYNDQLEKMIQRLQLQFQDLCEAKGIQLRVVTSVGSTTIPLSLDVRKNVYLICKEAIHNAVKYASCKLIDVSVTGNSRSLKITIRDNGSGFSTTGQVHGNGLSNMSLRAKEIKAEFSISSAKEGTSITIKFNPMSNGHTYFNL